MKDTDKEHTKMNENEKQAEKVGPRFELSAEIGSSKFQFKKFSEIPSKNKTVSRIECLTQLSLNQPILNMSAASCKICSVALKFAEMVQRI